MLSVAVANANRATIPDEYARTGISKCSDNPAHSAIASIRARISVGVRPISVPYKTIFSAPVNSGLKPAPNSIIGATDPRTTTRPFVGGNTRATTFSNVDLPAPLRPMTATVSPRSICIETPLRAKNSSYSIRFLIVSMAVCLSEETR